GGWLDALPTAGRYIALSFTWLIPLVLLSGDFMNPERLRAPSASLLFFVFASFATPPLFLIVALTADEIGEVFALYLGGLAVSAFLAVTPAIVLLAQSPSTGVMMLGLTGAFVLGLAVLL